MAHSGLHHALASFFLVSNAYPPIPVVARFKAWMCGRLFVGIACSNPTGARMSVCCECSVSASADHPSRGVLPSAVCLNAIEEPHRRGTGQLGLWNHEKNYTGQ